MIEIELRLNPSSFFSLGFHSVWFHKACCIFSLCNDVTNRLPLHIESSFSFRTDSSVTGRGWLIEAIAEDSKY